MDIIGLYVVHFFFVQIYLIAENKNYMKSIGWGRTGELCLVRFLFASACMQHSYKFLKEKKNKELKDCFGFQLGIYIYLICILAEICIVLE